MAGKVRALVLVALLVGLEATTVAERVQALPLSTVQLMSFAQAVSTPSRPAHEVARDLERVAGSRVVRGVYNVLDHLGPLKHIPKLLAAYPKAVKAIVESDIGRQATQHILALDAKLSSSRPLPSRESRVGREMAALAAANAASWERVMGAWGVGDGEVVSLLDVSDPPDVVSVTQVRTKSGEVLSTTTVVTDHDDQGNAVTRIVHDDGAGGSLKTEHYHKGEALEHVASHTAVDDQNHKSVVNVVMGEHVTVSQSEGTEGGSSPPPTTPTTPTTGGDTTGALDSVQANEVAFKHLTSSIHATVNDVQNKLDFANYVWFGCVVSAMVGLILSFPSMKVFSFGGATSWVFWTSVLCLLAYFLVISCEVIGTHKFAKLMIVWGANTLIRTYKKINEHIALVRGRVDVGKVLQHDKVQDIADRAGFGDMLPSHALLATQAGAQSKGIDVQSIVHYATTVPYEDLGYQTENICDDAWVNSETAKMTSDNRLVYSTEGSVESWSPVARWNLRRAPHQKQIPNPSHCHFGVGEENNDSECPGRTLFRDGSGDYCDCLEVLTRLGYDMEAGALLSCLGTRRDTVMTALRSLFEEDAEQGRARDAAMAAFTGTCFTTFDASRAVAADGAQVKAYTTFGSLVPDALLYSDSFASLEVVGSSLSYTLENCMETSATIEFRYAAHTNVPIQVTVGGTVRTLSDGSSTARQTSSSGVVFMRGNMVMTDVPLPSGTTELKITRTNTGEALYIHLLKVCTGGTSEGCSPSASSGKTCYVEKATTKLSTALSGFQGGAMEEFPSLASAMRVCDSRHDCGGVNTFTTGTGTQKYVAMRSTEVSDTTYTLYERRFGVPKDESGLCAV